MNIETVDFEKTSSFSRIFLDYVNGNKQLDGIFAFEPSRDGFEQALSHRKFPKENRQILVEVLKEQYEGAQCNPGVISNIELLNGDNTFTVTTGHQLNIFTGPLFFIYKIATTINLAKDLAKRYPEYNFVPVYWMASEDHDFAEINHVYQNGKKHSWESSEEGAVGRFRTDGLSSLADNLEGRTEIFKEAYQKSDSLAEAVRCYVSNLFIDHDLVVVDADDRRLKSLMVDIFKDDLINHQAFQNVTTRSSQISEKGYKPQINPREINLFYLEDGLRKRIVRSGDRFQIHETERNFSQQEILDLLDKEPEKFSPNVILRPLYQEVILPNLGYVGGPAELAYWLQLKSAFDHYKIDFPVLMPRNFGLYLDKNISRKLSKLGLSLDDLFLDNDTLQKEFLSNNFNDELSLLSQKNSIQELFKSVSDLAGDVDNTLEEHVNAQTQKALNSIISIESKMLKASKRKRDEEMRMLTEIHDYVYPGGTLQERRVNILSIHDEGFISGVMNNMDPFELKFNILKE